MDKRIEFFKNIPTLNTDRLILRRILKKDIPDIYEYSSKYEVSKYLLWSPHPSIDFTKTYFQRIDKLYKKGEFYDFAIVLKDTGKMIGTVGFTSIDFFNNSAEIGYVISSAYHRRGFGKEAVRKIIELGFSEMNFHRLEAKFMLGNIASESLLKSIGFKFEGVMRDMVIKENRYRSVGIYSLLLDEYQNLSNNNL